MANPAKKREARKIVYTKPKERIADREKGWTPTTFTVPDGMETFKFRKEKTYRLTIVPFVVGEGNPSADPGTIHFERTYYTHANVGPQETAQTCSLKSFSEPCPICQQMALLTRQGNLSDDMKSALRPKERQLWLVIDHDERDKGIQLLECAHFGKGAGFGEMLDNKLDAADEDSPYQNFFHLGTDGMTLVVKTKKDSFNGREFYKPINMELEPRREKDSVPESILDKAPCLDDLIIKPDYDELSELFHGGDKQESAKPKDKKVNETPKDNAETEAEETEAETEEDGGDEATLEIGATVEFMLKGKMVQGEVTKINETDEKATVKVEGQSKLQVVKFEDLTLINDEDADDGDAEENGDDDDADSEEGDAEEGDAEGEDEPEDETEDEEDGSEGDEDPEDDDSGDDDIPFDNDDDVTDEEEEKPAPKKPAAKKPAPKPAPVKKPGKK